MIEIEARLSELRALGLHSRMRLVSGPQGPTPQRIAASAPARHGWRRAR